LQRLTEQERRRLLGQEPASAVARLVLLIRVAFRSDETMGLRTGANNLGVEKLGGKFVALPDRNPFALALLLQRSDEKGRIPFDKLPEAVQVYFVRLALRRESAAVESDGKVLKDGPFYDEHVVRVLRDHGLLGVITAPKTRKLSELRNEK